MNKYHYNVLDMDRMFEYLIRMFSITNLMKVEQPRRGFEFIVS